MSAKERIEISEPLDEWIEKVIDRALARHANTCPVRERVNDLESQFAATVGFMVGSGLLGGGIGAGLTRILGG